MLTFIILYEQWSLHSLNQLLWGKHFTVTIIELLNVISRIPIIHLLPIYFFTNSWNVRAAICLEGRLSLLALLSVYSLTMEDGSWLIPMVSAQLSVPLQQVEEQAPKPVRCTMCFLLTTSSLAWTLMIVCTSVCVYIYIYIYIYIWILDIGHNM